MGLTSELSTSTPVGGGGAGLGAAPAAANFVGVHTWWWVLPQSRTSWWTAPGGGHTVAPFPVGVLQSCLPHTAAGSITVVWTRVKTDGEKWSDSVYIVKVEPTKFSDVGYERR